MNPVAVVVGYTFVGVMIGYTSRRLCSWLCSVRLPLDSFRWPWPELLGGAMFAVLAVFPEPGFMAVPSVVFGALLVAITIADLCVKLIPDRLSLPGAVVGVLLAAMFPACMFRLTAHAELVSTLMPSSPHVGAVALALAGAGLGFGVAELIRRLGTRVFGAEPIGMGDSKLLLLIGAFLGPVGLGLAVPPALALALVFGLVYARVVGTPPPFGPALAVGAWVSWIWQQALVDALRRLLNACAEIPPAGVVLLYVVLFPVVVVLVRRVRRKAVELERQLDEEYERLEDR